MIGMLSTLVGLWKRPIQIGFLALVVALLAGCAGVQTPSSSEPSKAALKAGETATGVSPLPDGREGFVIRETAQLDSKSRGDFERAVGLLQDEEYAEAIGLLEGVIEKTPGVTAPYINLALAYEKDGKVELAETQLKKALELVPGHPVASNAYGLLCRRAGRFEEARAIYEHSLQLFPGYPPVCRNLGILCELYLNDLATALEHYETYSRALPDDAQVKLWVADLRARLGR